MEDLSLGRDFMKEYLNPPGVQFESQLDVSSDAIGHDRLEHQSVTQNDNVLNHKNVTVGLQFRVGHRVIFGNYLETSLDIVSYT